jgi:HTH-type transcriptional regulator, competence development regulator
MTFGEKVRAARKAKNLDLRTLAEIVGVHFTYLSKVENGRLDFGDAPGEQLINRLAEALGLDADELMLLAKRIPEWIRQRVLERPDAFAALAELDNRTLDKLLAQVKPKTTPRSRTRERN